MAAFISQTQEVTTPVNLAVRRFTLWALLIIVGAFTFLDYWAYSVLSHADPGAVEKLIAGRGLAPQQYRVGVLFAARFLSRLVHGHLTYRHFFALFDFAFAAAAGWLLREILFHTQSFLAASKVSRLLRIFLLLGLATYYLSWAGWYQRPETLACTFYVALSLYLISRVRSAAAVALGLIVLAIVQAFVRADVAILFHFGLFLYVLFRGARGFLVSRGVLLLASCVSGLLATGILWVIMHKIYPQATYGDTPVFQLLLNLAPGMLFPFFLFIAPTIYTYLRAQGKDATGEGVGHALLLAAALYFVSWALVGRLQEVRIFIPFAFALMPQTANAIASRLETA